MGKREKGQAYKGFKTWVHATCLNIKMIIYLALCTLVLQALVVVAVSVVKYGDTYKQLLKYIWLHLSMLSFPDLEVIKRVLVSLAKASAPIAKWSIFVWLLFFLLLAKFKRRAEQQQKDEFIRGARLTDVKKINKSVKQSRIKIGEVKLPLELETRHAIVVGRPGVGKTQLLCQVLERLREHGLRAVVYDFKGDYVSRFYDPNTDYLFNPLDRRCVPWSLFNDIRTIYDIEAVAASLISPPVGTQDPFWPDAARAVMSGLLHYLYSEKKTSNKALWEHLTAPITDLTRWLSTTRGGERGYTFIQDATSKQALGVIATMMQYAQGFEFLSRIDGSFSFTDWLKNDRQGFIFVVNYANVSDTIRPLLSLAIDLLSRQLLSMPDDLNRRIFFVIDEFGTLQRLSTITKLLTLSRSKGGSVWLGIQDKGQIVRLYGESGLETIFNACATKVIFSIAEPQTARFLSDLIGEAEIEEREENISMGVEDIRDGISITSRRQKRQLFLPSELMNLPDLRAIVKIPGFDYTKTRITIKNYKPVTSEIILRDDVMLDAFHASQGRQQQQHTETHMSPDEISLRL